MKTSLPLLRSSGRWPFVLTLVFLFSSVVVSQQKSQANVVSGCSHENALEIIQEQIGLSKTIDDDVRRIAVLIRGADVIWPYREEKARAAFSDAFEIAQRNFKEKGDAPGREGKLMIETPDQRYRVITAIANRDSAWAAKLTDQLLREQQQEAANKPARDAARDAQTAERLLTAAGNVLSTNQQSALGFARTSLQFPATLYLSIFLFKLAGVDKSASDQLYQEAFAAYANAPMERFLYLSSYPFGNNREAGDMPGYAYYRVPEGFVPSAGLQRLFVQNILRRAQLPDSAPDAGTKARVPDRDEMWLALTRLKNQIEQALPDLAPAVSAARESLFAQLPEQNQKSVQRAIGSDNPPERSFDELIEAAEKNPDTDRRDQQIAFAIIGSSKDEPLDHVLSAIDKLTDPSLRDPIINWLYFERAQAAIKTEKLDDAKKLAAKVQELDQRAYLYSRIAEESLKGSESQAQARTLLDEVVDAATKAPATAVTARALLSGAYLYTKVDVNRAIAVLGEAIKVINKIDQPDFSRQFVTRRIEGKTFGSYASFETPGFNPETGFKEIGKADFEGVLYLASNFSDKSLRALSTLALVESCLTSKPATPKPQSRELLIKRR